MSLEEDVDNVGGQLDNNHNRGFPYGDKGSYIVHMLTRNRRVQRKKDITQYRHQKTLTILGYRAR